MSTRTHSTETRYVITHVHADGLRALTFACQGRNTYATQAEAESALAIWRNPDGLPRVLSASEMESLAVRPVECWLPGPNAVQPFQGDPVGIYFDISNEAS